MQKLTVFDLKQRKGKEQLTYVQVTSKEQAAAAEEAGIDMLGTAFQGEARHIPQAAKNTHFKFGLKYGRYASAQAIITAAFDAIEHGADSVYTAQSLEFVSQLAREGIPVFGHVGLVPPLAGWTGGYRAVGKSPEQALAMYQQVKDYENAGAIGVEIEVVPYQVATEISKRTELVTISMGAGSGCDVQYLFSADILGETTGHIPRHAKVYRNFNAEHERLQRERVAAYSEFAADVKSGAFPAAGHVVEISDENFDKFMQGLEKTTGA